MSNQSSSIKSLTEHIDRVKERTPAVTEVLNAFEELLIRETQFKETLKAPEINIGTRDLARDLRNGTPLGSRVDVHISEEDLKRAFDHISPGIKKGFPTIADSLDAIDSLLDDPDRLIHAVAAGSSPDKNAELAERCESLKLEWDVLVFVASRLVKPFAEKWGEAAAAVVKDLEWLKGYCPLCGSWPNFSFWKGEGGKRWLRCSYCGHEWTYIRTACPFCENTDQQKLEAMYSEDAPFEAADICLECKRYILRHDLREEAHDVFPEVSAVGMAHLDILAQEKCFLPPPIDELSPGQIVPSEAVS